MFSKRNSVSKQTTFTDSYSHAEWQSNMNIEWISGFHQINQPRSPNKSLGTDGTTMKWKRQSHHGGITYLHAPLGRVIPKTIIKMVQTASLHRHACVRVGVWQCSPTSWAHIHPLLELKNDLELSFGLRFDFLFTRVLGWESDSAARLSKRSGSVLNCLWGNALKRSPGIIRKSRVSYPGPGFLSSATWPSLPKKHYNGLNQTKPTCTIHSLFALAMISRSSQKNAESDRLIWNEK